MDRHKRCNQSFESFSCGARVPALSVDVENKVIAIGNPALNIQIREFFMSKIEGKDLSATTILTSVSADKVMYDYGTIPKDSTGFADFTFTNTGDNPFVITRVAVSCGCDMRQTPGCCWTYDEWVAVCGCACN